MEVIGEERQAQQATSNSSTDMDRMRVDSDDLLSGAVRFRFLLCPLIVVHDHSYDTSLAWGMGYD